MKQICDSLNGIIDVPKDVVKNIIDTPAFQRLRRIEQTSVRSIFPSAHHDRFVHSLGVYHVGKLMAISIRRDLEKANLGSDLINRLIRTFEMACLLHDVAHAPFSHTFEDAYGSNEHLKPTLYDTLTQKEISTANLKEDDVAERKIAPHEIASAILSVKLYGDFLISYGVDLELMCRMIMGWKFRIGNDRSKSLDNCLIDLLNGGVIDADRLDYVRRDVKSSGYTTSTIDLPRLLKGIHFVLEDDVWQVCYEATTFNEVEAALEVRYFQSRHIFPHHKICYEQWLLRMAVAESIRMSSLTLAHLTPLINTNHQFKLLNSLINIDNVEKQLLSDDDIVCKMKDNIGGNPYAMQWLGRQYGHSPLWKSVEEYNHLFGALKDMTWKREAAKKLGAELKVKFGEMQVVIIEQPIKKRVVLDNVKLILKDKSIVDLPSVRETTYSQPMDFVYIYVDKKFLEGKTPVISRDYIKDIIKSIVEEIKVLNE